MEGSCGEWTEEGMKGSCDEWIEEGMEGSCGGLISGAIPIYARRNWRNNENLSE
jgi:hypothetical protein